MADDILSPTACRARAIEALGHYSHKERGEPITEADFGDLVADLASLAGHMGWSTIQALANAERLAG